MTLKDKDRELVHTNAREYAEMYVRRTPNHRSKFQHDAALLDIDFIRHMEAVVDLYVIADSYERILIQEEFFKVVDVYAKFEDRTYSIMDEFEKRNRRALEYV